MLCHVFNGCEAALREDVGVIELWPVSIALQLFINATSKLRSAP